MPRTRAISLEHAQKKIILFLEKKGRMPGISDIMKLFGYKSRNTAFYLVNQLIEVKLVEKDRQGKLLIPHAHLRTELPVLGMIPAGFASPVEEGEVDTISLDEYLIRNKEASYILKVRGDSMRDAGIADGDMVIFERNVESKPGDIVVAIIEGGYTLKYLKKQSASRGGKYYLEPANPAYPIIYPKEGQVIGVVVSVFRKYK